MNIPSKINLWIVKMKVTYQKKVTKRCQYRLINTMNKANQMYFLELYHNFQLNNMVLIQIYYNLKFYKYVQMQIQ